MRRFFYPNLARFNAGERNESELGKADRDEVELSDIVIELDKPESHHATRVLRLRVGDQVSVFDGAGMQGTGVIARLENRVLVKLKRLKCLPRSRVIVDIATALPKGSHADEMLNQLSQLGVDRVTPLLSKRSVVNPRPAKLERFRKAAIESAKQCGRDCLMEIGEVSSLDAMIAGSEHDLKLIASTAEDVSGCDLVNQKLAEVDGADGSEPRRILVLIGPEGGWADQELAAAKDAGFVAWSLGALVMRIETAATAAGALICYLAR
jgi:16S rRNA (uracil1498-N3)-methyltransferase